MMLLIGMTAKRLFRILLKKIQANAFCVYRFHVAALRWKFEVWRVVEIYQPDGKFRIGVVNQSTEEWEWKWF